MLGRLMTEWLTSKRAVRRSTGKGTTFEERAKDREFLLFFFSLSTLRERDFLKRGGSRDG